MVETKTVTVEIDGKPQVFEYKTSITFGEKQKILGKCYDMKNPYEIKFDGQLYQRMILETVIVNAPFDPKDYTKWYELDDDVVQEIQVAVLKEFPLERLFKSTATMLKPMDIQKQT